MSEYNINKIFEELDKRKDIEQSVFVRLELLYLPFLSSRNNSRKPIVLYDELSKNPDFFAEVLTWVYLPGNKDLIDSEKEGFTENQLQNRASRGHELLTNWDVVPGSDDSGKIDGKVLNEWVDEARKLASKTERTDFADIHIGKAFALFPETNENWPPNEMCEVIERINTEKLKRHFSTALYNKRGSSMRGVFDGGKIERDHATYFKSHSEKIKNKFPNVAKIFADLASNYENSAKRMDEEAEETMIEHG